MTTIAKMPGKMAWRFLESHIPTTYTGKQWLQLLNLPTMRQQQTKAPQPNARYLEALAYIIKESKLVAVSQKQLIIQAELNLDWSHPLPKHPPKKWMLAVLAAL
jgi:hypothetical protein